MELRQLRDFLAVVDCGSLGDAARRLRTTQPSLTKSIQALERSIGGALFVRSTQGMKPTALGRRLEVRARVISGEVGRAQRELGELVGAKRGKVVIGSGPSFLQSILSRAVPRLQKKHPQIDVVVCGGHVREMTAAVRTGAIDFSFHALSAKDLNDDELACETVLPDQATRIVADSGHPLAKKRRVTLAEIHATSWMLPEIDGHMRARLDGVFTKAGLPPLQASIELGAIGAASSFLRDSDLVTVLVDALVRDEIDRGDIAVINVPELNWKISHSVVYRRGIPLPPAAKLMLDEIKTVCREYRRRPRR